MKKNLILALVAVVACIAIIVGIVAIASYLNRGNGGGLQEETESDTSEAVYVPPAETPATWSDFDVNTTWSETDTSVSFAGANAEIQGGGASLASGVLTIRAEGTYVLSGAFDGQIYIEVQKTEKVHLVFNGLKITCGDRSPVLCEEADKLVITLADGTENTVNDTGSGFIEGVTPSNGRFAGAIHSKVALTVNGNGRLNISTTYRHGIVSNSNLRIVSGTVSVTAEEEGLKGKETLSIRGGTLTVNSAGDGLKVSESAEEGTGFLAIEGGDLTIHTESDGLDVASLIRIVGGTLRVNSKDHALTTEGAVSIAGNPVIELDAYSGSEDSDAKGIKAEGEVAVEGGRLLIRRAYEGIESKSASVRFLGGVTEIISANDGVNAGTLLSVENGSLFVNSAGDGLDSGGNIEISGGSVVIQGSPSNAYAPMDVPEGCEIRVTGGFLLAYGSYGAVQYPSASSAQAVLSGAVFLEQEKVYTLRDSDGEAVYTFKAFGGAQTLCVSGDALSVGKTYTLYADVTAGGIHVHGVYKNAQTEGGDPVWTVTIE